MDITNGLLSFGFFEIFYHLLPEHRGYGFATEAVKEVTGWALENYNIEYLIGTAATDNFKSQHVLERCGYQFVEVRRKSCRRYF